MKTRILLADSRRLLLEGLCALLEPHTDIKVVGSAEEGLAAVKLAEALTPDVALVHLSSSAQTARRSIENLRSASPQTRVIAMIPSNDARFIREILSAGAAGCLTKDCTCGELLQAIRTVMTKKVYLCPASAAAVLSGYVLPNDHSQKASKLSAREKQILQRIGDGENTKRIAAALGVSVKTIETHRRRMMKKLKTQSIVELTKYAIREGITSLELQT